MSIHTARSRNKYMLYARVSPKGSTWDAEETSIGVQFADMRAHILRLDPAAEFIEVADEFKSGKNLNRPGVQRIMADLERHPVPWGCLVVWNLDRLSRSLTDALPIFSKIRDAGCEFISINQEYLSYRGAMARYMLHQTIAIAELERGMTSERVSAKMRHIASQGKIPWGNIPIGYIRDPEKKNTVIVDPEKAEIVRTIFDLYVAGKLSYNIINDRWPGIIRNRAHLYQLLRQRLYIGELNYAGEVYQTEHPAIIEREIFEKAQEMLSQKKRQNYTRQGVQKYEYLLSGIVRCHCDRQMTGYSVHGRSGKKFFYYKCTNPNCKNAINAEKLDAAVLKQLEQALTGEEIKKSLEIYLQSEQEKYTAVRDHAAAVKLELETAAKKEEKIKQMFLDGVVTSVNAEFWNEELSAARTARESAEKELAKLTAVPEYDISTILPALLESASCWSSQIAEGTATTATKRNLIMSLIEDLRCTSRAGDKIGFQLSLIMNSGKKWWANTNFVIIRKIILSVR